MNTSSAKRLLLIFVSTTAICAAGGAWFVRHAFLDEIEDYRTLPERFNYFRVDNSIIPLSEILLAGPGRDGIPAILDPTFVTADTDEGFSDRDTVISFTHNGETRAYPLKIVVWHEIVNDTVGGKAVAVTYCPLCGTSMVFDRVYDGDTLTFGVTGLLYKSDVLMYDHQTESMWSQLKMMSVAGELVNTILSWLPSTEMTLGEWRKLYPDGKVLSKETGVLRNYHGRAYAKYFRSPKNMFPVGLIRDEFPIKDWVVGIKIDGLTKAYPISLLRAAANRTIVDSLGDTGLRITLGDSGGGIKVENMRTNKVIPHVKLYWFAWQAFYPDTQVYKLGQ